MPGPYPRRTYDYFLCRGKQDGVCSMPYVSAAELERELGRSVARISLSPTFTASLREQLDEALATVRHADRDLRTRLQKQRDELGVREHRLLDLAADADLDTATLKSRPHEIVLQRAAVDDRLSQTNEQLQQGRARIDAYLDLLERPGDLYDRAADSVRRQLIEAFFVEHLITIDETGADLAAEGVMVGSVARLHHAQKHYFAELHAVAPETAKSPSLSTGALALSCLARMLRAPVSSKDHMVGRSALYSKPDVLPRLDPEGKVSSTSDLVDVLHLYSKSPYPEKMTSDLIKLRQRVQAPSARPETETAMRSIQRRLGSARIQRIIDAYCAGTTAATLASEHGIARNSVLALLRERSVPIRRQPLDPHKISRARAAYEAGQTLSAVAASFDVATESLRRALLASGCSMRPPGVTRSI